MSLTLVFMSLTMGLAFALILTLIVSKLVRRTYCAVDHSEVE